MTKPFAGGERVSITTKLRSGLLPSVYVGVVDQITSDAIFLVNDDGGWRLWFRYSEIESFKILTPPMPDYATVTDVGSWM